MTRPDPTAADRLEAAGLRRTRSRLAVLETLLSIEHPVSHGELAAALTDEGFDQATIYRNLMALTDAGLVRRADLGDHIWRFELHPPGAQPTVEHAHFLCDGCGDVRCVDVGSLDLPDHPGVRVHEVVLKGVCDGCARPS